jgi:hypothetical protein
MARGTEKEHHSDEEPKEDPYPTQPRDIAGMHLSRVNPIIDIKPPRKAQNDINRNQRKKKRIKKE